MALANPSPHSTHCHDGPPQHSTPLPPTSLPYLFPSTTPRPGSAERPALLYLLICLAATAAAATVAAAAAAADAAAAAAAAAAVARHATGALPEGPASAALFLLHSSFRQPLSFRSSSPAFSSASDLPTPPKSDQAEKSRNTARPRPRHIRSSLAAPFVRTQHPRRVRSWGAWMCQACSTGGRPPERLPRAKTPAGQSCSCAAPLRRETSLARRCS